MSERAQAGPPHHCRHGEALEEEALAAVTVPLEDHEVSVVAHLPAEGPAGQTGGLVILIIIGQY